MKSTKSFFLVLSLIFLAGAGIANASTITAEKMSTEENEVVCQFNDFFQTKIFVDADTTHDKNIGVLGTKVLEMATVNARANNFRPLPVTLVKVLRSTQQQVIYYYSSDEKEMMTMLEVSNAKARLTRNVDKNGRRLPISLVEEARCEANEPY